MAKFTFKLERPKKDGSRKIIIHIEHRLGRKNIPTPFYAQKSDLHKSGIIKNALLLQEVLKFRNECESIYASAGMVGITFTAKEIGDYIVKRLESDKAKERAKNGIDIIAFIEHVAKSKSAEKTQEGYKNLAKRLQNFVGDNILFTSAITVSFLKMFEKTIGGNGRNANRIMTNFKACFLQARKEYNNSDDGTPNIITNNPFEHYDIPKNPVGAPPAPLTPENYTALMNYEPTEARETLAKDVFLFSLFTCGMNTADIYALTKENIKDGRVIYCRRKVSSRRSDNALISIPLNNYATAFLDKYITVAYTLFRTLPNFDFIEKCYICKNKALWQYCQFFTVSLFLCFMVIINSINCPIYT